MDVTYQTAMLDDASDIMSAFAHQLNVFDLPEDEDLLKADIEQENCFIAKKGQEIVGHLRFQFFKEKNIPYLHRLAVADSCRRKGIASELLRRAEERVLSASSLLASSACETAPESINWHMQNGFQAVGILPIEDTNRQDILFEKNLVQPSNLENHHA